MCIDWQSQIFDLMSQFQGGGRDVISYRKLLPPGEWTRSVWPAPVPVVHSFLLTVDALLCEVLSRWCNVLLLDSALLQLTHEHNSHWSVRSHVFADETKLWVCSSQELHTCSLTGLSSTRLMELATLLPSKLVDSTFLHKICAFSALMLLIRLEEVYLARRNVCFKTPLDGG